MRRKPTFKWRKEVGHPEGQARADFELRGDAAKEAFEEAGVIGVISPSSVGMFRARKGTTDPQIEQIIEVWVYRLEVTEMAADWPEKGKREIRWVSCEFAARQLREPVLSRLCCRLA